MSVKVKITGNNGNEAFVDEEGSLNVVLHPHPPILEEVRALPFRQYMTDNGKSSGDNAMNKNGSTTAIDFYITASNEYDIYINSISVEIGDGGTPALNLFGALPALTNGVGFYWVTNQFGEYELHEGIKTNKEFIRIGSATIGFGNSVDAFLADVSGGGTEKSYFPIIDFSDAYGLQYGVRLKKNSNDKLVFRINDNLTGLTTFNAQAFGIRL